MNQSSRTHILSLFVALAATSGFAEVPTEPGWHAVPNTKLRGICAGENGFPEILGNTGCKAITLAWNGGVFDTTRNRMIVFGGGHNDYFGNELYAFNLEDQTIERLTDPGLPKADGCVEDVANGTQPNSRHTYDGVEYIGAQDKIFVFGGALACSVGTYSKGTWTFDFQTNQWQKMNPSGPIPDGNAGMLTAYDPVTGLIYLHDRQNLFSYDVVADAYTQLTTRGTNLGYHMAATIHPTARKFVIMGRDSVQATGKVYTYDISTGSDYSKVELATSGGSSVVNDGYPGVAYDVATNEIVAWSEDNPNIAYSLDLNNRSWAAMSYPGGPTPVGNGTHGRWRYSPESAIFVLVNKVDDDIYFFKSGDAEVVVANPPGALDAP